MATINKTNNASYGMVAPDIEDDADKKTEMVFPTAEAVDVALTANAASVAVRRETTIVKLGTLAAAATVTLVPEPKNLNIGSKVMVNWTSDSTGRNVSVKVGNDTIATLTGTASETVTKQLVWDGNTFIVL